jgi:uncharacterized cupredoxin-like copper-binding protein
MKKLTTSIAAAAALLGGILPSQAATFQFNDGDLILGFSATSGTGASRNVFFNLGSAVAHRNNPNLGNLGNIGATLSFVYGSNWYSREDLYFGVIGNLNNSPPDGIFGVAPVAGDPSRTFYISIPAAAPQQGNLTPAGTFPSASLGSAGTKLGGMEDMLVGTSTGLATGLTAEADKSAVLDQTEQPVQWANGWSSWNPVPGAAFDVFTGGIVQNFGKTTPATYVDLQRILATNTGANPTGVVGGGTYVTSIAIASNGGISAQTTPVVLAPRIVVEQPAGEPLTSGSGQTDFKAVETGKSSAAIEFQIRNDGTAPLSGLSIAKTGANVGDFVVTDPGSNTLPPGESTTFSVVFKPAAAGARKAVIAISSNDTTQSPFTVEVIGTGRVGLPSIEVYQPSTSKLISGKTLKNLGTVPVGRSSSARVFTIRNTGGADLSRLAVRVAGKQAKDFIVTKPLRTTLAPGASTTFRVTFKPKAAGNRKAALRIVSNDPTQSTFVVNLFGKGRPGKPSIDVFQPAKSKLVNGKSRKSLGTVKLGRSSVARAFTIRNTGGANLTRLAVSVSGADAGDFVVTKPLRTSLPPGAATTFRVTFKPTVLGTRSATLQINSNDTTRNPFTVQVTGLGAKS